MKKFVAVAMAMALTLLLAFAPMALGAYHGAECECCVEWWFTGTYDYTTIGGYQGNSVSIRIPAEFDGFKVTTIGDMDSIFHESKSVVSVTVPAGITRISNYAFADNPSLTSIYFEGSLPRFEGRIPEAFGDNVFENGSGNLTLYIPKGDASWDEFERNGYPGVARIVRYTPGEQSANPSTSDSSIIWLALVLLALALAVCGFVVIHRKKR